MSLFATYTYDSDAGATNGGLVAAGANGVLAVTGSPVYTTSDLQGSTGFAVKSSYGSGGQLQYAAPNGTAWTGSLYVTVDHYYQTGGKITLETTPAESTQLIVFNRSGGGKLGQIEMRTGYAFDIADSNGNTVSDSVSCVNFPIGRQFRIDWQVSYDGTNMTVTARFYVDFADGRTTNPATGNPAASGTITATFAAAAAPSKVTIGANKNDWPVTFDTFRMWTDNSSWPGPVGTATPTVAHTWVGDSASDGFIVTGMTVNCDSLRLAVSPNSNMSSPVTYFTPDSGNDTTGWTGQPDDYGWFRFTVSGLSADTTYYYQVANTPSGGSESLIGSINKTWTTPPAGSAQNFTVALTSCQRTNSTISYALDDIRTVFKPHFMIHLGDLHYSGGAFDTSESENGGDTTIYAATVDDPSNPVYHEQTLRAQISNAAGLSALAASVPMFYTISDHEYSSNNGDTSYYNSGVLTPRPEALGNLNGFIHSVPYRALVDPTTARYRSWVVGRIRFILLDVRTTDRHPGEDFDPSQGTVGQYPSKNMLGANQLQWLKDQLQMTEPLKVMLSDTAWMGGQSGDVDYGLYNGTSETRFWDKWANYATERQEIADFITGNTTTDGQPIRVDMWHGDSHLLGTAVGTGNPNGKDNIWGGFPVICGSPIDQHGIGDFQDYFDQTFNNGGTSDTGGGPNCAEYFRISITDDGSTITRTAQGFGFGLISDTGIYDDGAIDPSSGAIRISQSFQWDTTSPRTGKPKVWDGSAWVQHDAKVWDGSTWVVHAAKGYDGTDWIESK